MKILHVPVLLDAVLEGLNIQPPGIYIDATFGRGGHARAILEKLNQEGRLFVFDRDPEAIFEADTLAANDKRVKAKSGSFKNLYAFCEAENLVGRVDGIVFDLGVFHPHNSMLPIEALALNKMGLWICAWIRQPAYRRQTG